MLSGQAVKAKLQVSKPDTTPNIYLGLIAAAVTPVLFFTVIFWLLWMFSTHKELAEYFSDAIPMLIMVGVIAMIFALPITFFHVVVFGIPLAFIGSHYNYIRWWVCLPIGFILGFIPITTIVVIIAFNVARITNTPIDGSNITSFWVIGLFMGLHGLIGGLAFWLGWRGGETLNRIVPKPTSI